MREIDSAKGKTSIMRCVAEESVMLSVLPSTVSMTRFVKSMAPSQERSTVALDSAPLLLAHEWKNALPMRTATTTGQALNSAALTSRTLEAQESVVKSALLTVLLKK